MTSKTAPDDFASRFPLGTRVTLASLDRDPYPVLAELREHEPVTWVPEIGMWLVTRRPDVLGILRDARRFTTEAKRSTIRDIFGAHMMTTDGDVALRYKRSCLHAFRSDVLAKEMAPWVEHRASELIDRAVATPRFDLMSGVATPLAVESALRVLGLPFELGERIEAWFEDFARALANFKGDDEVRRRGKDAAAAFDRTVRPLLADASPTDRGLLARLASRTVDRLTNEEIVANALIILFGGIETTASMIGNTVWALLATDTWPRLVAEPALEAPVIEESLRWQPAVQSITRHTTERLELCGLSIPAGSIVQSMIGGANRDPAHFPDPDAFLLDRPNSGDHLSFGTGRHLCLGAHLARIEIGAVLRGLAERAPGLRFADASAPELTGYEFRRPSKLPLAAG